MDVDKLLQLIPASAGDLVEVRRKREQLQRQIDVLTAIEETLDRKAQAPVETAPEPPKKRRGRKPRLIRDPAAPGRRRGRKPRLAQPEQNGHAPTSPAAPVVPDPARLSGRIFELLMANGPMEIASISRQLSVSHQAVVIAVAKTPHHFSRNGERISAHGRA